MTLAEARDRAIAATKIVEDYASFKPRSAMVLEMLITEALAALKVYETAVIIDAVKIEG